MPGYNEIVTPCDLYSALARGAARFRLATGQIVTAAYVKANLAAVAAAILAEEVGGGFFVTAVVG
jgi:hypothetical protein